MRIETRDDGFYINDKFFFPVGFNYWPRDVAVRIWKQYDSKAIEREFQVMKNIGINCIRMFILWDDLNPQNDFVDESLFNKFDDFLSHAIKYGVKLNPTLLIGHMSGQDWFPEWMKVNEQEVDQNTIIAQKIPLPPKKKDKGWVRDIYTDHIAVDNALKQIDAFMTRYKDEEGILAWDLSNENQYWMHPKTPEIGQEYMKLMYNAMKCADPNHPVTYGMGKLEEITGFNSYGPKSFATYNDYYSVHVYPGPIYYPASIRYFDFYVLWKLGFIVNLARINGKPIQMQEFGLSQLVFSGKWFSKDKLLKGYYNVGVWSFLINRVRHGILSWCFTDFDKSQRKEEPYDHKLSEMTFGNVDVNYSLKPSGIVMKKLCKFLDNVDFSKYFLAPSQVAIVMPENYNMYLDPEKKPEESFLDDSILKMFKAGDVLWDSNINQNKTLYSAFLFCKMNQIQPEFIDIMDDSISLKQFRLLILPNLKHLSEKSQKRIHNYLEEGGNVYISSNDYIPTRLLDDSLINPIQIKYDKQQKLGLKVNSLSLQKIDPNGLIEDCTFKFKLEKLPTSNTISIQNEKLIQPLLLTSESSNTMMTVSSFHEQPYRGNLYYMITSPEINHTKCRNKYKREPMVNLYALIAKLSGVEFEFSCSNSKIEGGLFSNKNNPDKKLLILINHDYSDESGIITLSSPIISIKEIFGRESFDYKENTIEFNVGPYQELIFLVDCEINH